MRTSGFAWVMAAGVLGGFVVGCEIIAPKAGGASQSDSGLFHRHGTGCGHIYRGGQWISVNPNDSPKSGDEAAFIASMNLVEQGGGQTQTLWDKGDEKYEAQSVRYYQSALQKFPKNPWAYYYLGKLYSEKKQLRVAKPHLPLTTAGCFLLCRELRQAVSTPYIDSWIVHKYPHYRQIMNRGITDQERKVAWPFTMDFEDLENRIVEAMNEGAEYIAMTLRDRGGNSAKQVTDGAEGRRILLDLQSEGVDAEHGRVVAFQRDGGQDFLVVLAGKSKRAEDLQLRFGMSLAYAVGAPTAEETTLRRLQAEAPTKVKTEEALRDSMVNDLNRNLKMRYKNLIETPLQEIEQLEKVVEECDRKLERTDQSTEEGAKDALVLVKTIKDHRLRIKTRREGVDRDKSAYAEAEKEHARALKETDLTKARAVQAIKDEVDRYEKGNYAPALEAHRNSGKTFWPKLRVTLTAAFE